MLHAVASIIFVIAITKWLGFELKKPKMTWKANISWAVAVVLIQSLSSLVSLRIGGKVGNFVLHFFGGGVASTLLFIYLVRTFRLRVSWRLELASLFMFVSALGCLNELFEYAVDSTGLLILSFDRLDTWRDILANTSGAILTWVLIKLWLYAGKNRGKGIL